ncbi:hypothetical protein AB395_0000896 [Sinorhizobium fredii CCBAU 45436]|nr:hypothetical protein AB395_0000896 [Sinorhizobium fredii CCBAU 45436]
MVSPGFLSLLLHVSLNRSRFKEKTCSNESATATFARLIRRAALS